VLPATLSEVLSQSDFVSMHAPARPESPHARRSAFKQMKKSAIFINTGAGPRGRGRPDQGAAEGWIAHAALDVLEKEPPSHNNPMLGMENVTLTAHVASASARFDEARKRRVGYELSLVLQGMCRKLRQSVVLQTTSSAAGSPSDGAPEQLTTARFTGEQRRSITRRMHDERDHRRDRLALAYQPALATTGRRLSRRVGIKAADVPAPQLPIEKAPACDAAAGAFVQQDEDVFRQCGKFTERPACRQGRFRRWRTSTADRGDLESGAGPDIIIGFSDAPHIYADK